MFEIPKPTGYIIGAWGKPVATFDKPNDKDKDDVQDIAKHPKGHDDSSSAR